MKKPKDTSGYLEMMGRRLVEGKVFYTFRLAIYQDEAEGKKPEKSAKQEIQEWELNPYLGKQVYLTFTGKIRCVDCGRPTKKSFNQGSCYVCFTKLAANDFCILRPVECHFYKGTCREPEWGLQNCFRKHVVYLAFTSGGKVGITKEQPLENRWIDQGAVCAIPILETNSRLEAGILEKYLSQFIPDKTSWQKMLSFTGEEIPHDLEKERDKFLIELKRQSFYFEAENQENRKLQFRELHEKPVRIEYPILTIPKLKSFSIQPGKKIGGKLVGIKGQYLLFDTGVIHIRNYQGYHVIWEEV